MVKLAILWHMHQPYYEDLATGEHILPWVRLHAIKDYWGMVALLREFPDVRVTFNLVPSLLVQVQAYADDRANDRHLQAGLIPAADLDADHRAFLVANGFHAQVERMILPQPRYAELYQRRLNPESFDAADLRDLQVLHKLVWMDPDWLESDARLVRLVEKQRRYTEADKQVLREVELELLKAVIPAYAERATAGQIELSTSPFYHPILPLLCDSDVHLRAHPHSTIPRHLFARSGDAQDQLERAMTFHEALFGAAPAGVWPSEGSVSDEVIGLIADRHVQWTATDEEILLRSRHGALAADALYRPYELGGAGRTVRCLFRDHALSDLIGFAYQSWDAERAVDDFVGRVVDAGRRFDAAQAAAHRSGEVAIVTVILDGENAWEHYPGGGRPFLRALYGRLERSTTIETVTMAAAAAGPAHRLPSIAPGSWINGDFYIWAGHPDDHRAWTQLAAARDAFERVAPTVAAADRERAWTEIAIAEGSDWFWWYGDDHSSDHDREFDDLFRRHLRNVYRALGQAAPHDLDLTNISTSTSPGGPLSLPALTTPTIDGNVTGFGEWQGSVVVPLGIGGGTMHRVAGRLVRELRLAANRREMFLRLDGVELAAGLDAGTLHLVVATDRPRRQRVTLSAGVSDGARWATGAQVVEAAVPFLTLGAQTGDRLSVSVLITDPEGHVVEQHPADHPLEFDVPSRHLDAINWNV